jgi:hypothetical protein
MKKDILSQIEDSINYAASSAADQAKSAARSAIAKLLIEQCPGEVTDTVNISPYGGSMWVSVYNREDLQFFLQIAPQWSKKNETDCIAYEAEVHGVAFKIRAYEAALPATCVTIEEEVIIPAQPERKEMRKVVKCTQPAVPVIPEVTTEPSDPF